MPRTPHVFVSALALALLTALAACGSGGDPAGSVLGASDGAQPTPFAPSPPPAAWTDDGCANCHGADGSGGSGGPNIHCVTYARLDAHVRTLGTSHTGGAFPALTDDELFDLEAFLRTADCPGGDAPAQGGIPPTHTKNEDGVLHHPDYETNRATCTACHGANLEGSGSAPACASCHGGDGFDDEPEDEHEDD